MLDVEGDFIEYYQVANQQQVQVGGELQVPQVEHRDLVLTRTKGTQKLPKAVELASHWMGYFDGGSAKK